MKKVNTRKNLFLKRMLSMVIVAMVLMTVANVAVLTASALSPDFYIPYGEVSVNVEILEKRLDELQYMPIEPDDEFDDYTVRAIKDFQYLNGLESTGEADAETLTLLFSGNAIPREDPARIK